MVLKNGWDFTRAVPLTPLLEILPSRWDGLTVQRLPTRSRASDDIHWGYFTFPSTILIGKVSKEWVCMGQNGLTAHKSSLGFDSKMAAVQQGTRRQGYQTPTNRRQYRALVKIRSMTFWKQGSQWGDLRIGAWWTWLYLNSVWLLERGTLVFHKECKSLLRIYSAQFPIRGPMFSVRFEISFANPKSTSFRWPSESRRMFSGFKSRYAMPFISCKNSSISTISAP